MKIETIDEFLARGGQITKLESIKPEYEHNVSVKSTVNKPPHIMSLDEGEFYFGEVEKAEIKAEKKRSKINMDILPDNIKKLFNK